MAHNILLNNNKNYNSQQLYYIKEPVMNWSGELYISSREGRTGW